MLLLSFNDIFLISQVQRLKRLDRLRQVRQLLRVSISRISPPQVRMIHAILDFLDTPHTNASGLAYGLRLFKRLNHWCIASGLPPRLFRKQHGGLAA